MGSPERSRCPDFADGCAVRWAEMDLGKDLVLVIQINEDVEESVE